MMLGNITDMFSQSGQLPGFSDENTVLVRIPVMRYLALQLAGLTLNRDGKLIDVAIRVTEGCS